MFLHFLEPDMGTARRWSLHSVAYSQQRESAHANSDRANPL